MSALRPTRTLTVVAIASCSQGVDPLLLSFMVCNAGSLVWHAMECPGGAVAAQDGGDSSSGGEACEASERGGPRVKRTPLAATFMCDDAWEQHVDWRWDARVVQQVRFVRLS